MAARGPDELAEDAAGLFDGEGELRLVKEDVGRHNAADKILGTCAIREEWPLGGHGLVLSGRASFEMVQKALMAGFAALVCVGAPTSLAIEMANESHLTLVGFATGPKRYNVYAGAVTQ